MLPMRMGALRAERRHIKGNMVQKSIASMVFVCGLLAASVAHGSACPTFYMGGKLPEIRNAKLNTSTRELCYEVFGIMHSGVTRTPLWSAEHLTARNLKSAQHLSRENSFHAETALPEGQRAELADYARSGFDRGHMAPNADMPDRLSQHESFTLANMVPQNGQNNRHAWAGIEGAVRKLAKKDGDVYVITGPVFAGGNLQKIGNVLVPSHIFKVVYSPRQRAGAAYYIENKSTDDFQLLSIAELESKVGINLLPSLTTQQKQAMLRLPKIRADKASRGQSHWTN